MALFTGASGGTPTDASAGAFQSFLDVSSSSLDLNALEQAFEGSALKIVVNAGDQLDFNWAFLPASFTELDYAFSVFNGAVTNLANTFATGSFSQTFASSGLFSIGLVDIGDTEGDSILTLNGASYTPVPTPALLPGLICLGLSVVRKRKQQSA
ncbi:MAG: PTPA-CTERM sorting domain-containing protein [Synechococcales cyanobacterium RU_4_20]|nr:PTPA-CTERM sorting domain-containing protein [Synechococcales cyanobacterium RU_4_20]